MFQLNTQELNLVIIPQLEVINCATKKICDMVLGFNIVNMYQINSNICTQWDINPF